MRLGFRCALVMMAGGLAGCLSPNPNLPMGVSETGEDSSSGDVGGSPSTSNPATTDSSTGPIATSTTDGPTTDPDTTETETSDAETTGPAACGSGNVCAPAVPGGGWAGPVIWAETPTTDEPPACPGDYPEPAFSAFDDLQAPPANCDCDCGAASGASCAMITLEYYHDSSNCSGGPEDEFTIASNGTCNAGPAGSAGRYWEVPDAGVTGGSCSPVETVDIPPLGWNSSSTVCGGGGVVAGGCGSGEECVPAPAEGFESRLCIWKEGNLECPNGDYGDRFVRHASESDGRNCQTCSCGNPEGECSGNVRLWTGAGCGAILAANLTIGGNCTASGGNAEFASLNTATLSVQNVSCEPSVGTAIGEAEPAEPHTLCCISL